DGGGTEGRGAEQALGARAPAGRGGGGGSREPPPQADAARGRPGARARSSAPPRTTPAPDTGRPEGPARQSRAGAIRAATAVPVRGSPGSRGAPLRRDRGAGGSQIGRASCRERV